MCSRRRSPLLRRSVGFRRNIELSVGGDAATAGGAFVSVAAGHLELVVTSCCSTRPHGHGARTRARAATINCPPDGEWSAIRFRLGVHMLALLTPDCLSITTTWTYPCRPMGRPRSRLARRPLPDLDNAERYVDPLARRGVTARDEVVEAATRGDGHPLTDSIRPAPLPAHHRLDARTSPARSSGPSHATALLRDGASHPGHRARGRLLRPGHLTRSLKVLIGQRRRASSGWDAQPSFCTKQAHRPRSAGHSSDDRGVPRGSSHRLLPTPLRGTPRVLLGAVSVDATVVARFAAPGQSRARGASHRRHHGVRLGRPGRRPADFSGFSLSLTVSDDAEAERLFAALTDEGRVQVPMAPTPFASRLGLVADKFGVRGWSFHKMRRGDLPIS